LKEKIEIPAEIKIQAVEDYLAIRKGSTQILDELGIWRSTFQAWLRKYEIEGPEGLHPRKKNRIYSPELKIAAVREYLSGGGSLDAMCRKYGIHSHSILQKWINLYNQGHDDFKTHHMREGESMTKGRKATQDEKIQAVLFCLEHDCNYQLACEYFSVSYQQIYRWVQKYNQHGEAGLIDRRGRNADYLLCGKSEKKTARLHQLEAENRRLQMENDLLKKLNELERGCLRTEFVKKQFMKPLKRSVKKRNIP